MFLCSIVMCDMSVIGAVCKAAFYVVVWNRCTGILTLILLLQIAADMVAGQPYWPTTFDLTRPVTSH